jgi:hypothetical protein
MEAQVGPGGDSEQRDDQADYQADDRPRRDPAKKYRSFSVGHPALHGLR